MTGSHTRVLRRRPLAIWSGLALITALTIGSSFPALAAEGCDNSTSNVLAVTIANASTGARFTPGPNLGDITTSVSGCGSYTGIDTLTVTTEFPSDDTYEVITFEDAGSLNWPASISVDLGDESDDTVVLEGTSSADTFGASLVDTQVGIEHFDLYGFQGADVLTGGSTEDALYGGDDDDTLTGGDDDDAIYAGDGADTLYGGNGDDHLDGEEGTDTIWGGADDDYLHGGDDPSLDTLHGEDGEDLFDECSSGTGPDTIDGGNGRDTVDYSDRSGSLTITLDAGSSDDGESGEMDDIVAVEDVLGGSGADVITGNGSDNHLSGGVGADDLFGEGGNDILEGGADPDDLSGGDGSDTASYEHSPAGVTVDLLGGSTGDADGDTLSTIENLHGSDHADVLTGDTGPNTLSGEGGWDDLYGGGGNDVLIGGYGSDDLNGGDGNDLLSGGDGDDNLFGGGDADTLRGGSGVDTMVGDAGNDSLYGEAGVETAGYWSCGSGTDKANVDREDGFTKNSVRTSLTDCERFAGSYAR